MYFEQALRTSSSFVKSMAHARLGQVLEALQEKTKAESNYVAALKIDPFNAEAASIFAKLLIDQRRASEALEILQVARSRHVNHSGLDTQMASAHHEMGDPHASCAIVRKIHAYGGSGDGGFGEWRCRKQEEARIWLQTFKPPAEPPGMQHVTRRHASELSFAEFYHEFAMRSRPLVIEGGGLWISAGAPWNVAHIRERCGDKSVSLRHRNVTAGGWAQLSDTRHLSVAEFIDQVWDSSSNQTSPGHEEFIFDWSLPSFCPELAEEFVVPRYFASDFMQRVPPKYAGNTTYRETWPSLFLQKKGSRSGLHVDSFGSNFFLALLEGHKRWVFFDRDQLPLLYPNFLSQGFAMDDVLNPDYQQFPLLRYAKRYEAELSAGDVIFVPAGAAHQVENLADSVAVSMNYVDGSNLSRAIEELFALALRGGKDEEVTLSLAKYLSSPDFNATVNMQQEPLSFYDFKRQYLLYQKLSENQA